MSKCSYDANGKYSCDITEHATNVVNKNVFDANNRGFTYFKNQAAAWDDNLLDKNNLPVSVKTKSISKCFYDCENNPKCLSFDASNNPDSEGNITCFLKKSSKIQGPTNDWTNFKKSKQIPNFRNYVDVQNMDIIGNDLSAINNSTLDDCYNYCNQDMGCKGFGIDNNQSPDNLTCYLKTSTNMTPTTSNYTMYAKQVGTILPNSNVFHNDIPGFNPAKINSDKCITSCLLRDDCGGYVYQDPPGGSGIGNCYLKNKIPIKNINYQSPDTTIFAKTHFNRYQ